jgi:hypothetical protein
MKKITAYQANDGTLHLTERAARTRDYEVLLREKLECLVDENVHGHGTITPGQMVDFIVTHRRALRQVIFTDDDNELL